MTAILSIQEHKDPRLRTYFLRRRLFWPIEDADQHLSFSSRRRNRIPQRDDAARPAFALAWHLLSLSGIRVVEPNPFHVVVRVTSADQWTTLDTAVRRSIDAAIRGERLEAVEEEEPVPVLIPAR